MSDCPRSSYDETARAQQAGCGLAPRLGTVRHILVHEREHNMHAFLACVAGAGALAPVKSAPHHRLPMHRPAVSALCVWQLAQGCSCGSMISGMGVIFLRPRSSPPQLLCVSSTHSHYISPSIKHRLSLHLHHAHVISHVQVHARVHAPRNSDHPPHPPRHLCFLCASGIHPHDHVGAPHSHHVSARTAVRWHLQHAHALFPSRTRKFLLLYRDCDH